MAGTTIISKGTWDGHSHPILIPKVNNLLIGSGFQPQPLVEGRTLKLVALVVPGKSILQRDYLISDATIPGAINHYESSRWKWDSWCSQRGFIPIRCDLNPILEFLTKIFHQRLTYNTICCCRSPISAYHDSKGPFSVGKHAPFSSLTINRVPQPRYSYRWGVEKVLNLLNSLDSERIGLKMLTYIVTLVLTRSSRAQQRCYLNICYLIKHSSGYTSHFNKLKKATRKVNLTPTINYLNFSSNKNL